MHELADNALQAVQKRLHNFPLGRAFMNRKDSEHLIKALSANWQTEMGEYHTYNTLSQQENDPYRRRTLRNLALAEKHHAEPTLRPLRPRRLMTT
jgi:hypothetical protein